MAVLRVAICQINTKVGDLLGNAQLIRDAMVEAEREGADLALFPELTITGYPPEDLLLKSGFVAENIEVLHDVARSITGRCAAAIGFADGEGHGRAFNALAVVADGEVKATYHKRALPNSAVFDEKRVFLPGIDPMGLHEIAGIRVGISICEDAWIAGGPISQLAAGGAQVIINMNASPYYRRKTEVREAEMRLRVEEAGGVPLVYGNQVGGQDELVFDGSSFVLDASGAVIARAGHCVEEMLVVDVEAIESPVSPEAAFPVIPISPASGRDVVSSVSRIAPVEDANDVEHCIAIRT